MIDTEQVNKLTRKNKYKLEQQYKNIKYVYFSRRLKREIVKQNKDLEKQYEEDQNNQILELREKIEKRRQELRKEIIKQFESEGKNLNNACTQKSITFWTEKKLVIEFGFMPSDIEDCSLESARKIYFRKYTKEESPYRDNFIFDKKDEELDPISQLAKHDAQKWVSTMIRLELFKRAKRNGLLGMYQDSYGKYQI